MSYGSSEVQHYRLVGTYTETSRSAGSAIDKIETRAQPKNRVIPASDVVSHSLARAVCHKTSDVRVSALGLVGLVLSFQWNFSTSGRVHLPISVFEGG